MTEIKNVFKPIIFALSIGFICILMHEFDKLKYENFRLKIQIKMRDTINIENCKRLDAIETFEQIIIINK